MARKLKAGEVRDIMLKSLQLEELKVEEKHTHSLRPESKPS
jgi:hypothetical protein